MDDANVVITNNRAVMLNVRTQKHRKITSSITAGDKFGNLPFLINNCLLCSYVRDDIFYARGINLRTPYFNAQINSAGSIKS